MDSHTLYAGMSEAAQQEWAAMVRENAGLRAMADAFHETQAELERAHLAAEHANNAKSLFLAMMSHELRTPMTGILGILDLLMDSRLDADQYRLMKMIKNSANSLLGILNDILDFSKIEAGQMQLEEIRFDAVRLFKEAFDHFQFSAREKKLDLQLQQGADAEYWSLFRGDPMRLRQIVVNLLSNAIKFTSAGAVILSVSVENHDARRADIVFSVSDTGIGMTPEQQERLFNSFMQASTDTTRRFGGTGLGLAIVKRLVDNMNGKISVESIEGQGTTFTVRISLPWAVPETELPDAHRDPLYAVKFSQGRALNVLLVEDSDVNQMIITSALTRSGHRVQVAENGQLGLDAVMQSTAAPYDVILMDIHMPVMDGVTATRAIRALPPPFCNVPIIGVSADALPHEKEKYLKAGLDDYVTKPIQWGILFSAMARVVDHPA